MTSFVLVPGALHSAEHFERLALLLRNADCNDVATVELPYPDEDWSLPERTAFAALVAAVVAAVDSASKPVVLLGHSTAGCVITAAAAQRNANIQKLVFLAAETLPGPPSFALDPKPQWLAEGLLDLSPNGRLTKVAENKGERLGDVFYSGATAVEREAAVRCLRPSPTFSPEACDGIVLESYWGIPKAYIKCTRDLAMLPVHQDTMHARLREGARLFELACDHCPFVSCPERLAALLLEIAGMPALQFQPLRQLCESSWEDRTETGVCIEVLAAAGGVCSGGEAMAASMESAQPPPPKRQHVPQETSAPAVLAYRISKSRRDSTLVKVLKFPAGVALDAQVFYWYESFVDDPAQYTNSSLNVPERGHEAPLDVAGISRSLCAEGTVTYVECSRVAFSWRKVATKVPGSPWALAEDTTQVWGIDGREWNGSYMNGETGTLVENLAKYSKGSADAFWEDVPRKATDLLARG